MGKGIFVIDFDDVLVYLSKKMYSNIRENWRLYKEYFWDPGELTNEEIQSRQFYYMNEWLIHKKYIDLEPGQYSTICLKTWELFVKTFFCRNDIYDDLKPTEFARKTLMNPLFIDSNIVSKVYILSRNITLSQSDSKKRFIEKYFNHPKISYINVTTNESKADVLIKNNIDFDVFIDDELKNIRDVVEKFKGNIKGKEFIIPHYGYNDDLKEIRNLIEEQQGSVNYYEPFEKEASK